VASELAALHAAHTSDLVDGAPPRALVADAPSPLPYSHGRVLGAELMIDSGPPCNLVVGTHLSISFTLEVGEDGTLSTLKSPHREDVVAATKLALAGETKALDAASSALTQARVALPPERTSWSEALVRATVDARVPREQLVGEPTWHLIFAPWSDETGWNGVLLDAQSFRVLSVNGRAL
jgi:hypothetical protein